MNRWAVMGIVMVCGAGLLAYLRIVSNELAIRLRALNLRIEAEHEEAKLKAAAHADDTQIHDAETVEPAEPISAERAA